MFNGLNKKFIIILSIIIGVFVIGGGIMTALYFTIDKTDSGPTNTNKTPGQNINILANANNNINAQIAVNLNQPVENKNTSTEPVESTSETEAIALVKSFVERFGSFSSQNNYENLLNLKIYMTGKMQKWSDDFIEENKKNTVTDYYGISTKAITVNTTSFSDKKAIFLLSCQRRETRAEVKEARIFFQNIEVVTVAEDGQWKVDSATWK